MKCSSEQNRIKSKYHVQYINDMTHKNVKIYFAADLFPELPFYGPQVKTHWVQD